MSEPVYRVYCTNCETEVAKHTDATINEGEKTGSLLSEILHLKDENALCYYHGSCRVQNYQIQKGTVEYNSV